MKITKLTETRIADWMQKNLFEVNDRDFRDNFTNVVTAILKAQNVETSRVYFDEDENNNTRFKAHCYFKMPGDERFSDLIVEAVA